MNKKVDSFRTPMVGGSSLLVIFAVLCLTMFALLGLSTVQANKRLIDASIKAVTDYYAADCEAEEILARIRNGQHVDGIASTGAIFGYTCHVSDTQMLVVQVRVDKTDEWDILRWEAVPTAQNSDEELLKVWSGENLNEHE